MTNHLRNAILLGVYCSSLRYNNAFSKPAPIISHHQRKRRRRSTVLHRNSPGFVGFRNDNSNNFGGRGSWEDSYSGQVGVSRRESNLAPSRRDSRSANEDPRSFDYERRYSQPPHPSMMVPPHMQQQSRGGFDGRIQGGSRHTYSGSRGGGGGGGQTFVETDGRPLDVEVEVWDGPNNTPTRVKMYSEDGRQRPMNILTNNYGYGGGGGTMSVRNVGSMEFPLRASVASNNAGYGGGDMMGGNMGDYYGSPYDITPRPSTARGETVQGGSLKTFTLPTHVNAAQVTITSDGLPVNAKVELWGTSTQIKQLAEVYNDNGQTRPFAAIIDVPGGENTIAVRNTGPLEYPIRVVVEPVGGGGRMGGGGGGGYGYYGGGGRMMDGGGFGMNGPPPPPPPMMMDGPYFLPPPPPF